MDHAGYADFRARREASIWQQLNRILRALLLVALVLVIVSLFIPQRRRLAASRAEIEALQTQVDKQRGILARQTREAALLKTDPSYLEIFARDRLDLMKDGETVFRIDPPKPK